MSILTLLIVLLVVSALFGAWRHPVSGYVGWSPLGIVLVVLLLMWAFGGLGSGHGIRLR